jgi:hypothetical protein
MQDLFYDRDGKLNIENVLHGVGFVIGVIVTIICVDYGFEQGGLGGAILGLIVGGIACCFTTYWTPVVLVMGGLAAAGLAMLAAGVGILYGVLWLIHSLWGVGKPG